MSRTEPPSPGVTGETGRRPRIEDVATLAGLSTATVSLALGDRPGPSEATRVRVRQAAAQLGYRPNRNASMLARRRTRLLGVLMNVHNSFHAALVDDLHVASDAMGYDLVLSTVGPTRGEERALQTLLDDRCEALLLLGPVSPVARLVRLDRELPLVVVGRRVAAGRLDVVRGADDHGVRLAVEHLLSLGHRRIAYLDGGQGAISALRRRGYQSAMRRNAVADLRGSEWVIRGLDDTEAAGGAAGNAVLAAPARPTAVVCHNDRGAIGCYDTLLRAGVSVPGEVSLVGYDDSPLARLVHLNLTSVSQDTAPMATQAVQAAVGRLEEHRPAGHEVVIDPHLVVRGTTGPAGDVAHRDPTSGRRSTGRASRPERSTA